MSSFDGGGDASGPANAFTPHSETPHREAVARTLEAIVASGVLGKGDRRAKLLHYLVDSELDGRGEEIKAFSIALDVLGRDASFDPTTDSIVRSEVGRLRDALRLYFAERAAPEDIRIEIPKGTYRPVLCSTAQKQPRSSQWLRKRGPALSFGAIVLAVAGVIYQKAPLPPAIADDRLPIANLPYDLVRIAVAPFTGTGSNPGADGLAFGTYAELATSLAAYPWISVVSPVGGVGGLDAEQVDYVLLGDLHWDETIVHTNSRLVDIKDHRLVWGGGQSLAAEPDDIRTSVAEISSQIAFKLGSAHGIAPELAKARNAAQSPENLESFLCFLSFYSYTETPTDSRHLALRECLLEAVERFPTFGDGWAALAMVFIDEARFDRNPRRDALPWQDAGKAIGEALKHAPLRMPTLNVALIYSIEAPDQKPEDFARYASLLLQLFPRHPMTLYNVGSRMAEFAGRWDEGLALVNEAIELDPDPPSAFFVTQAYHAAVWGTDAQALSTVAPLTTQTSESQLLLHYLAAARNGLFEDMRDARLLLSAQGIATNDALIRHVSGRRHVAEIETALLEQLDRAFQIEPSQ